jgi:hypothetical protein
MKGLTGSMTLSEQRNFRLASSEAILLRSAALHSSLTESQWLRLVVLTALGKGTLPNHGARLVRRRAPRRLELDKQKNFRLETGEAKILAKAALHAGLPESQWLRLVVLAALGETSLLEQLTRVAAKSA